MVDLFRLLVFVTVVDRNGYSAAARQLHLAQPTISHHVSELEKAFNTELLHYQQRSVHLTAAGQEVYRAALMMLAEQERLAQLAVGITHVQRGNVNLPTGVRAPATITDVVIQCLQSCSEPLKSPTATRNLSR